MATLTIRDDKGDVSEIFDLKGKPGKSAYEYAQDGGYTGTGEEFAQILNSITSNEVNSWSMVQNFVRLGIASKVFKVGDQLVCHHDTYGELIWDIIGIDHDTPANSEYTHSLTLQLHECLNTSFVFDTPEPTHRDVVVNNHGNNNWEQSNMRQWLNSDGEKGNWWQPTTDSDVQPAYATTTPGFLKGLDEDFIAVIGEVSKKTAKNTRMDGGGSSITTEKMFLLSVTEVYGGKTNNISEGSAYSYYAENSDLSEAGTTTDSNRVKTNRNEAAQNWWLRSPRYTTSGEVMYVSTIGGIYNGYCKKAFSVAPACCVI